MIIMNQLIKVFEFLTVLLPLVYTSTFRKFFYQDPKVNLFNFIYLVRTTKLNEFNFFNKKINVFIDALKK